MKAELISIGDELLIGQTINTNASWLGSELALINIKVSNCQTISDTREAIWSAFDLAFDRSDLIIVTGGLGPTKDDITKHVLCEYFDTELEINPFVLQRIETFFRNRNRPMLEVNIKQAELPKACKVIDNLQGTASGMWFERDGKILISLPGVPYEMKGMMKTILLEKIQDHFQVKAMYHKTVLTTGIGESFLAEQMADWENRILADGFSLAFLPSPGMVKLRITSYNGEIDAPRIETYLDELKAKLPEFVYGEGEETLATAIGKLLLKNKLSVSTVESCTGGGLASEIVSVAGSSAYFKGSLICYTEELKSQLAGVDPNIIQKFGVVSKETVEAMAFGGLNVMQTDYCLATTGIAGPDGGDEQNPVGTIWIAVANKEKVVSKKLNLGDNRDRNIKMTIFAALNLLRNTILENNL
ncbi:MAG: competence/damage-inducible protein A [Flavobacteriia bacterium]